MPIIPTITAPGTPPGIVYALITFGLLNLSLIRVANNKITSGFSEIY